MPPMQVALEIVLAAEVCAGCAKWSAQELFGKTIDLLYYSLDSNTTNDSV